MAEQATSQQTEQNNWLTAGRTRRLKWSSDMISDLLECKKRAQELASSEEPARNTNGRKKGYMKILNELWSDLGYAGLNLTSQNSRDQAARMEKTMGNVRDTITRNAGNRREKQNRARESEELIMQEFRNEFIVRQSDTANLHSTASTQVPVGHNTSTSTQAPEGHSVSPISTSVCELLQLTDPILASVAKSPGDFSGRRHDTRTKQRPTGAEVKDVNAAVSVLLKHNKIPDPAQDPFGYLWIANCILYSVIVAFYISKGWKKGDGNRERTGKPKQSSKAKEEFEAQAREIRGKLSKAKAEIERLKSNKIITKKERRTG